MGKKGQINHIFIYIVALIIMGLIMFFGYSAIASTIEKGCEVQKVTFKNRLDSFLTGRHRSFGTNMRESLQAPCGYEEVCFVDYDKVQSQNSVGIEGHPIIASSVEDGAAATVFLVKEGFSEPILEKKLRVSVNDGFVCIPNKGGVFKFFFSGQGDRVKIREG